MTRKRATSKSSDSAKRTDKAAAATPATLPKAAAVSRSKSAAPPLLAKARAVPASKSVKPPKSVKSARPEDAAADHKPAPAKPAAPKHEKKAAKLRPVLVRDSFTMPESDFALIAVLKARAMKGQRGAKKSELLRAGLHILATLDVAALVTALGRLEAVKTGRPKKGDDN
jgi:hypothetical protein